MAFWKPGKKTGLPSFNLMTVSVSLRGNASQLVKNTTEISLIFEAHLPGNITDIFRGLAEEFFGSQDAVAVEVIPGRARSVHG